MLRILSWNIQRADKTQGFLAYLRRFMRAGHDVICLQEAMGPLSSYKQKTVHRNGVTQYNVSPLAGRARTAEQYTAYSVPCGESAPDASMLIYTRLHVCDFGVVQMPSPYERCSPMFWLHVNDKSFGNCFIGMLHLPLGNFEACKAGFDAFNQALSEMSAKVSGSRFALVGNFNIRFAQIASHYNDTLQYFHHMRGYATHQSGCVLDYVYYEGETSHWGIQHSSSSAPISDYSYFCCALQS